MIRDLEYEPENERSKDMDHNKGKSVKEQGFHSDDRDFYKSGDYERKDSWGNVVTHQDSKSFPTPRGQDTF